VRVIANVSWQKMGSTMNIYRNPPERQVKHLLAESQLPASDLSPGHLEHFFGCGPVEAPKGVVGLEVYDKVALLRSLAVSAASRGNGYGKALVAQAERYARSRGVTEIYLSTTTAAEFFERLGYKMTDRETAPDAIRQTQEFSALCPSSSAFMVKTLPANPALQPTR
jgi:amino-acid N-acetyltransferase